MPGALSFSRFAAHCGDYELRVNEFAGYKLNDMKSLAENRRARFDYAVLETYEAGIELTGQEVKSVKSNRASLAGSFALIRGGEAWLTNAQIPPYQAGNAPPDYDASRTRRLLLSKNEIKSLEGKLHEKGYTLVPLRMYLKRNLVKVELGLARSKKHADRRQDIKKKEDIREARRLR